LELFQENLGEPIQERFRQGFSATGLPSRLGGILAREDEEVWMACERLIQLRDIDLLPMVQDCVETFKDRLLGKVHFVNQEPVTFLDRLKQHTITPAKLDIVIVARQRILAAQQVHHVGLVA